MERPRSHLLAIVGGSCSGKSTVVDNMVHLAPVPFARVDFDDYFLGKKRLEGQEITDWESPELYRYEDYIKDLEALKRGEAVRIEAHSRESTEKGITERIVTPEEWVVVNGFLATYTDEVARLFDRIVFLDISEEEMIRRRLARSKGHDKWNDPDYIENMLIPGYRKYVLLQAERTGVIRLDGTQRPLQIAEQVLKLMD